MIRYSKKNNNTSYSLQLTFIVQNDHSHDRKGEVEVFSSKTRNFKALCGLRNVVINDGDVKFNQIFLLAATTIDQIDWSKTDVVGANCGTRDGI